MIPISPIHVIGELIGHIDTTVSYINDVQHANEDQKKLLDEAHATQGLLRVTQDFLKKLASHATEGKWKATINKLNEPGGLFHQLSSELEKMAKKLTPHNNKFDKAKKAVFWHFIKGDIKKHFDRIERIKSLLSIALQNDLMWLLFI